MDLMGARSRVKVKRKAAPLAELEHHNSGAEAVFPSQNLHVTTEKSDSHHPVETNASTDIRASGTPASFSGNMEFGPEVNVGHPAAAVVS